MTIACMVQFVPSIDVAQFYFEELLSSAIGYYKSFIFESLFYVFISIHKLLFIYLFSYQMIMILDKVCNICFETCITFSLKEESL